MSNSDLSTNTKQNVEHILCVLTFSPGFSGVQQLKCTSAVKTIKMRVYQDENVALYYFKHESGHQGLDRVHSLTILRPAASQGRTASENEPMMNY